VTPALHFAQFGKYEIIRKLGRSMTDVYLALDPDTNRRVILKIVEQCRDAYTQLVVDAERRGAMIQQQLHAMDPRILEVYDYGDQNGCFYLVMQYAEGHSLAEVIHKEGRLDPDRAARYGAEICSQLQTLHSFQADIDGQKRAVVHGDIKPANIQIGPQDELWLLDFGIAKAITATRNLTQHNLGSPAYCSPERLRNSNVDPYADLWAVGVCLYEMVAGMPPYQAQTTRKLENLIQSRRPPRALPEDCPGALKAVISKALAADPTRRYPSALELEDDLRRFLDGRPVTGRAAWDANATVEKNRPQTVPVRPAMKRRASQLLAEFNVVMWSLIAGLVIGLLCFLPASHFYRYWKDSAPLRAERNYKPASAANIESEWRLYRRLEQTHSYLGGFSPVPRLADSLRTRLIAAGDDTLEAYRDSTDPDISRVDWDKARLCFRHALDMEPASNELKGKLAVAEGYLRLTSQPSLPAAALESFRQALPLLPKSPDPHLGLARIYVYTLHNLGLASVELHAAERAGYKLGPREFEQQADAYQFRASQELHRYQIAKSAGEQARYYTLMRRDFDRARSLYEPISGFSKVSQSLERLENDEASAERLRADRERARAEARRKKSRPRKWR
jgi:serine/threonine protein kinase